MIPKNAQPEGIRVRALDCWGTSSPSSIVGQRNPRHCRGLGQRSSRKAFVWRLRALSTLLLTWGGSFSVPAMAAVPSNVVLGAERLFAFSRISVNPEVGDTGTNTSLALLGSPSVLSASPYTSPRFTLDYLAPGGFSIGGGLAYQSISNDDSDDDQSSWLLAPRLGYFALVGPQLGIWLRAGITYFTTGTDTADLSYTALTLEVPLIIMLAKSVVGLQIVPFADIGLSGGTDDDSATATEFGVHVGLDAFL